eukprot:g30720.t1
MIREDGLFRSSGNVNSTEPWNRERLHLQLERSLWAKEAAGSDELRADEARELLSPGLAVAKLAPEGIHWLNKLGVRFRSQVKSKRRHLVASQLYELRLDICRVSLFRSPAYRDLARGISPLEALDGREHRAAGELQERLERGGLVRGLSRGGDLVVQLDQRLDALVEHGKILRSTLYEEESRPVKLRVRRDEKESHLDELCKNLYGKWRELRQIRQDYGFTSTVWRLIAQVQDHDAATDGARKARNVEAEIEEVSYLQGLPVDQLRDRLLKKWDTTKRSPGMASYRFDLTANAALTSAEVLRSRAYDGLVTEAEARRKLAARVRVCVECRVQNRVVGCSPSIPFCWETGSSASAVDFLEEAGLPGLPEALRPVHSFNLAVHVMPQHLSLVVYISAGGWLHRWHAAHEVEVELPNREGKVTHTAVVDQRLLFGPDDDESSSHFRGEVAVCVSWPGEGRDSVVPPAAPLRDVDWSERRATCWPCGAKDAACAPTAHRRAAHLHQGLSLEPESLPDPLHEAKVEETYLRRTRRRPSEELGTARRSLRIEKLLERMEREGMTSEKLLVPAFEDEARREELKKLEVKVESKQKETEHQMEFRKRIQERTRRMASVKTHMSYKSIVREYGEEAEEGNLMELIERIQKIFQPKHTLRPTGTRRKFESSVRSIRVHVSVAKVYEAPLRVDPRAAAAPAAPAPLPPRPGTTWGYQGGFGGTKPGTLFGAEAQSHQLPEIVIELTLQDFQGNLLFRRTDRARKSTDPDINQILELPLHAGNIPGQEELTQDSLTKYSGELTINIFDELTQSIPSGREVRIRRQLRHLGRFVLPWSTLYSAKCSLKGNFLVDEHPVLFGYRPKVQKKPMVTTETGLPAPPPEKETPKPMCLALDVTVDPPLEHPTRVQPQITLGKEANMMLKHIQKWHDSLKSKHDTRALAS